MTLSAGGKNYLYAKQSFYAGTNAFTTPKLKAGNYSLAMSVTDPAGHYAKLSTTLQACKGGCPAAPYAIDPTTGPVPTVTVPAPEADHHDDDADHHHDHHDDHHDDADHHNHDHADDHDRHDDHGGVPP